MKVICSFDVLRVVALTAALPLIGQSAALSVNGVCVSGSCASPDAISSGTISGTINSTVMFADGDLYGVNVAYSSSYISGSAVTVDPVVTYLGTSPSAGADTVTLNFFQNFFDSSPGTFNGTYTETVPFNLPAGGTATAQLAVDGQGLGVLSAYGPGYSVGTSSEALTGLTGNTLTYQYTFNFGFAAGAVPGASASSVPEPSQTIPATVALGGFAMLAYRRSSNKRKQVVQ